MLNIQISNLTSDESEELEALGAVLFAARGLRTIKLSITSGAAVADREPGVVHPVEVIGTVEPPVDGRQALNEIVHELTGAPLLTPEQLAAIPQPPVTVERTEDLTPVDIPQPDRVVPYEQPVENASDEELSHLFGGNKPNVPTIPVPPLPAVPTPPPAGVEVDKSGLPWDERIHASTRTKTANGQWKKKRGVEDFTVAHVETELRQVMGIPGAATPTIPQPPAVAATVPVPPVPGAVPTPPPPPALVASAQAPTAFAAFMQKYSPMIAAGRMTPADLQTAVEQAGLPNLGMLAARPDLIPAVSDILDARL